MYTKSYIDLFMHVFVYAVILYILKLLYEQWRMIKMVMKFDGPEYESLVLGNVNITRASPDELHRILRSLAKQFPSGYKLRVLHNVSVTILDPDDIEIFMSSKKHCIKSEIYEILRDWMRDGLLLSNGEKWFKRRKILTPSFHFSILGDFVKVFNEQTERLVCILSKKTQKPIDIVPLCREFSLHVINETAMGRKLNVEDSIQRDYIDAVHKLGRHLLYRLMRPWLYPSFIYFLTSASRQQKSLLKILHSFTGMIVKERHSKFKGLQGFDNDNENEIYMTKRKQRVAMLDILLQANRDGNRIDYGGICEEVDTFMFEGHDTTATALSYCLMLIANHAEIQNRLYEEIEAVFPGDECPTYNNLQKMELLDRVIRESLRLYPTVHFISRKADEDVRLRSGLVVPKNVKVYFQLFDLHRNPKTFPNPEKFDPDRFSAENCQNRHPYSYLPFSAGLRNCIGQKFAILEMKSVITGILKNFRMIPVDTPDTIVIQIDLVLRTKNGIKIKFEPRAS